MLFNPDLETLKTSTPLQSATQLLQTSAIIGMGVALSVVVILMIVLATIASIAALYRCKRSRQVTIIITIMVMYLQDSINCRGCLIQDFAQRE